MSGILLFGAGKSATILIDYLVVQCARNGFSLEVVDASPGLASQKIANACHRAGIGQDTFVGSAYSIDSEVDRAASIQDARLVLSLLPPHLHEVVATDCLRFRKSLFTASYVDAGVSQRRDQIEELGLLFLYEMGLDPGIDHMSLMEMLEKIRSEGGTPTEVRSHCGGLVAPSSDDNPWHYKISWNPRNVLMAGTAGAHFLENGRIEQRSHAHLFEELRLVKVPGAGELAYYPNRDSLSYIERYGLTHMNTFIRTTLRHPDFIRGWSKLIEMGMIDEQRPIRLAPNTTLAEALQACHPLPKEAPSDLKNMLEWLGWADDSSLLPFTETNPASILQYCMEKKWVLGPTDTDRIVMMHEVEYWLGSNKHSVSSWLVQDGEDAQRTAMARTVGLPLGIAAIQFLKGQISVQGLQIPILPAIYRPVLNELKDWGIDFEDSLGQ